MKRSLFGLAFAITLALTGCSGGSDDARTPASTTATTSSSASSSSSGASTSKATSTSSVTSTSATTTATEAPTSSAPRKTVKPTRTTTASTHSTTAVAQAKTERCYWYESDETYACTPKERAANKIEMQQMMGPASRKTLTTCTNHSLENHNQYECMAMFGVFKGKPVPSLTECRTPSTYDHWIACTSTYGHDAVGPDPTRPKDPTLAQCRAPLTHEIWERCVALYSRSQTGRDPDLPSNYVHPQVCGAWLGGYWTGTPLTEDEKAYCRFIEANPELTR